MQFDLFGLETSLDAADVAADWDKMQLAFLAHGAATPDHLGRVLSAAPGFACAHAVKGLFCLLLGRRELVQTAREAHQAAQDALANTGGTQRERAYVTALEQWLAGQARGAVAALEHILRAHPEDALAMKLSHAIRFVLGDNHGMRRSLEAVQGAYTPDHPAWGYFQGCYAFALEETGDYRAAERRGREGVLHSPDDAWGLHAVAHVHDMTANSAAGLTWLEGREAAWAHCNNFRYHVWWHKALMLLDLGQIEAVLALYDQEIRRDKTDDYRDIANATSLLMRLELEGVDIGNRWEELADFSAQRTEDGCLIFADLHYLLGLVGGHRAAATERLIARIRLDAAHPQSDAARGMAKPGLAAAAGVKAFGDGDYATAFCQLHRAGDELQNAGGSHAQRDVFERMTIDAALRSGHFAQARTLLEARAAQRGGAWDGYARQRLEIIDNASDTHAVAAGLSAE